jgi:Type II CAAX prenyl endopeptidase Rce1-like
MKRGWAGRGDLASSLVLIAPLVFAYELGVVFAGHINGADLVTRGVYAAVGSRTAYVVLYAAIAAGFVLWIRHTRRWGSLRLDIAGPVILEAAVYALTLGAVLALIVDRLLGLSLGAGDVVSALGAGVHEELVFRLGIFCGLVAALVYTPSRSGTAGARGSMTRGRRVAIAMAMIGSSLIFAAAHHIGPRGEPWSVHAIAFRTFAGVAFCAVMWFRSLAHAVYAHVMYDIIVAATS